MASFNKVILLGNLTRDPELRMTSEGASICKLGLAVGRTYKDREGNQREETAFVDVDAFGRQAEVISQYFNKGKPILLEGRLKFDQWESSTGEKRNKLKVVLESFSFVGNRGDVSEGGGNYNNNGHSSTFSHGNDSSPSPQFQQGPQPKPIPEAEPIAVAPDDSPAGQSIDDEVPF